MSLSSSLARTDELRLKNVTIKTFLSDPGVHHTYGINYKVATLNKVKYGTALPSNPFLGANELIALFLFNRKKKTLQVCCRYHL